MADDERRNIKYYDKRIVHSFGNALNRLETGEWKLYCLHDSTVFFLQRYLKVAEWQSTWRVDWKEQYYIAPSEAELNEFLSTFNDYANRGLEPMCTDEIVTAINDLTAVIAKKNCNCGGSCGGCGEQPGGPIVDPPPNPGQTPGGPGPGGGSIPPDWQNDPNPTEAYNAYKCQAANFLVDGIIAMMDNSGSGLFAISMKLTLGTGVLIPILRSLITTGLMLTPLLSPGLIVILIGFMIGLAVSGLLTSVMFESVSSDLSATKNDVVCDLYNALTVDDARTALTNWFNTTAASYLPDALVSKLTEAMFTNNILNILFEKNADVDAYTGTVDCGACAEAGWRLVRSNGVDFGTVISGNFDIGTPTVIESKFLSLFSEGRQQVRWEAIGDKILNFSVEAVSSGGDTLYQISYVDTDLQQVNSGELSWSSLLPYEFTSPVCQGCGAIMHGKIYDAGTAPFRIRITATEYTPPPEP